MPEHDSDLRRYQALQAGLDLIDQGFTLIDTHLRLLAWNQAFLKLLDFPTEMARVGASFEDFVRYNAQRGEYGDSSAESLVEERLTAARTFEPHDMVRVRPNGTVLRIRGFPVPGHGFVTLYTDITEERSSEASILRHNAELEARVAERTAKLHRSEQQMRLITDSIPALIAYFDAHKVYRYINKGYQEWFGLDPAEPGKVSARQYLGSEVYGRIRGNVAQALAGQPVGFEYELTTIAGQTLPVRTTLIPDLAPDGSVAGCFELTFDTTEQRRTQRILMQAEKMEALGQLTGGLAHDFNNMLTVIIGNLEGLRTELKNPQIGDKYLAPALTAARRGTELIRGLLTFSRRQPLAAHPVDLCTVTASVCRLVRPALPERIGLHRRAGRAPAWALVDASQLENALVNLIMNARDAIAASGHIELQLTHESLHAEQARLHHVSPGDYVRMDIRDNGCGMDPQTLSRVFEPFFTTKPPGKGTGLGMAMVYGFIKQSGGGIRIDSQPANGTTVCLWLPASETPPPGTEPNTIPDEGAACPHGLAVLVEDDAQVRQVVRRHLMALGYSVLETSQADEALEILRHTPGVSLLISDIVMPGPINGHDLALQARQQGLARQVMLMTGHAPADIGQTDIAVLPKPFSQAQLREFLSKLPA